MSRGRNRPRARYPSAFSLTATVMRTPSRHRLPSWSKRLGLASWCTPARDSEQEEYVAALLNARGCGPIMRIVQVTRDPGVGAEPFRYPAFRA